ncbi:hypothetical protein [Halorubrum sp. AJ67]|nr:hypothetical protein BN903_1 [Halorubrum sp. AJ67]
MSEGRSGDRGDPDPLIAAFEAGYESAGDPDVLDRLRDVADRGRYR